MERVTSIETFKIASQGQLVEIPGYVEGETLTVRLRKPNMLTLIKSGRIPNSLLSSATELFEGAKKGTAAPQDLSAVCDMMTAFCEVCLVAPTFKELSDAGVELTQQQMEFIFNYSQGGVKKLTPFREEQRNTSGAGDVETVENTSECAIGN
jgi:hypothetical protein